jgi:hypothetical protein
MDTLYEDTRHFLPSSRSYRVKYSSQQCLDGKHLNTHTFGATRLLRKLLRSVNGQTKVTGSAENGRQIVRMTNYYARPA